MLTNKCSKDNHKAHLFFFNLIQKQGLGKTVALLNCARTPVYLSRPQGMKPKVFTLSLFDGQSAAALSMLNVM